MSKISCAQCKHHRYGEFSQLHVCTHPDARTHDRVQGYAYATLMGLSPQAVIDCDREGRFELYRPWWQFWQAA